MRLRRPRAVLPALVLALSLASGPGHAAVIGYEITLQGVLQANGEPASGVWDVRVTPYDAALDGAALAPAVIVDNTFLVEGVFSFPVDFGPALYQGEALWFEIAIRPGLSSGAFEVLVPRQPVTATPYAIKPLPASVTDIELANDAVGSSQIANGSIQAVDLAAAAVGTAQLAPLAVDATRLAPGAVLGEKLALAAVGGDKLADAAVSVDKLADAAVTAAKLAPDAVDSARILDGSVAAVDLAPDALPPPGWRLDGNAAASTAFLGTTNATPLALRSDVGVTINGNRFNNSTELTVRGSPAAVEANADIGLWPRDATAFFNLGATGTDPASARFLVSAVGTSPFTGYVTRLLLEHDGRLGLGGANPAPLAQLHVTRADVGIDAGELAGAYELLVEDSSAEFALMSGNAGSIGSGMLLGEMASGSFSDAWGLWRATSSTPGRPLSFGYGAQSVPSSTTARLRLYSDGSLAAGAALPGAAPTTSFVFSDGSSAVAPAPGAANQFLIRAVNGVGINGPPLQTGFELSLTGPTPTSQIDLAMREGAGSATMVLSVDGSDATDTRFRIIRHDDTGGGTTLRPRLWISGDGFTSLNGAFAEPAFPLVVGTNTSNGNAARLTPGGVWTNGSSRAFKTDFTAIEPREILQRLLALPVKRWRYRGAQRDWHLGPVAEDFRALFGLGDDERYIGTVDADGVALAAIQGLAQREAEASAALAAENARLRAAVNALTSRIEALEQRNRDEP